MQVDDISIPFFFHYLFAYSIFKKQTIQLFATFTICLYGGSRQHFLYLSILLSKTLTHSISLSWIPKISLPESHSFPARAQRSSCHHRSLTRDCSEHMMLAVPQICCWQLIQNQEVVRGQLVVPYSLTYTDPKQHQETDWEMNDPYRVNNLSPQREKFFSRKKWSQHQNPTTN